jgi:asparagine synthase (glutamine-hydrolysing)
VCGIVGIADLRRKPIAAGLLKRMTTIMAHRGPDGEGHLLDGSVGLGHRRLAIIDLTVTGHQPMANETGDIHITFNGEIYNFQKLRLELEAFGHRFRSRSDTEVIIHGYEQWGEQCLQHFNGMFAFAIWDRLHQRLFLARDRFGIKPLYWYCCNGTFICASEIKAILEHPGVKRSVCYPALNEYFTFQNIFTDLTLFEGIRLLPPGSHLTLDVTGENEPQINRYWDYPICADGSGFSERDYAEHLHQLFSQSVTRQLVSDVPVGSYLSGGMDSGSITAVAVRNLPRLTTFTCGFDLSSASGLELGFDERPNAEVLANLFKTEHYEFVLHAGDMESVLPQLIWHLEDLRVGQCYPNYYVARLASKFVKVVLSGAGGDELFAGYPWRYYCGVTHAGAEKYFSQYYQFWQRLVSDEDKPSLFNAASNRQLAGHSTFDVFRGVFGSASLPLETNEDYINASLYFELKTFLHGLLVVEDKISMAHSLETRVPFLDNELVDFACRIPLGYKLRDVGRIAHELDEDDLRKHQVGGHRNGDGKAVLRQAMSRLIPQCVAERIKQGFSAPDASWFRGESIDYVNRFLRDPGARIYEFLEPPYITRRLDEHTSGRYNHRLFIWSLLSFEWWLRKFM